MTKPEREKMISLLQSEYRQLTSISISVSQCQRRVETVLNELLDEAQLSDASSLSESDGEIK